MPQAARQSTTRRALLSAPPILAAGVSTAAPPKPVADAHLIALGRRLDGLSALEADLLAKGDDPDEAYYCAARKVTKPILDARATTWSGLAVKARVLLWALGVSDVREWLAEGELCTNELAALSIVRDLLGQ